jgi:hypothetical protein
MMRPRFLTCLMAALLLSLLPSGASGQSNTGPKLPPQVSGRWIVFRPGVTQMIGNKPLSIKGDCRTVVVRELYHQFRTMPEGRVKAKQYTFKICCKAKSIQALKVAYIGLDGKPLLKSMKPGPQGPVGRNPLVRRMHALACRLPLKIQRRTTPPAPIR